MTLTHRPSHTDGIDAARAIALRHGLQLHHLRPFAADHLQTEHPDLEEIGSSDVSCHLSYLGNWEPQLLEVEAARLGDRRRILDDLMARLGKTETEVLEVLAQMFAPA